MINRLINSAVAYRRRGGPVQLTIDYTATQFDFKWKAPSTSTLVFHWGDGTTSIVAGQDATLVTTTSAYSAAGTYDFWITGDVLDLTWIDINGQAFVSGDVSGWSALTDLDSYLYCHNTSVSGDISSLSTLTGLTRIRFDGTNVTGDISSFSALTSITHAYFHVTSVTGDVSGWSAMSFLNTLYLRNTSVTFDTTSAWSSGVQIYIQDCAMTATMVDNMIASFSTITTPATINIAGTNAHRTAASNDDLNTLLANGNTITLNDVLSAEKITDGGFPDATNWDVADASWAIAAGVAAYDDLNDDAGISQADGDMVTGIAINTVYRLAFSTAATPTTAALAIKNAAEDTVYFAQANYTDDDHVIYFTSPADVAGGGIAFVAYQSGDPFDLDDVSLKTVTLS